MSEENKERVAAGADLLYKTVIAVLLGLIAFLGKGALADIKTIGQDVNDLKVNFSEVRYLERQLTQVSGKQKDIEARLRDVEKSGFK